MREIWGGHTPQGRAKAQHVAESWDSQDVVPFLDDYELFPSERSLVRPFASEATALIE
jgi:hypothetical protein